MRKIQGGIITTIVLVSLLIVINPVSAATWHVYSGDSIQTAVNNASSGDTIYVHAGTYNEMITVSKDLTLIGDGASVTIINGGGGPGADIYVHPPSPALITVNISGFTLTGSGWFGICYDNNSTGVIRDNIMAGNGLHGVYVHTGAYPTIVDNLIIANTRIGIYNNLSNPSIVNNVIVGNGWQGINNTSSSPTITNNTITGNTWDGIYNVSNSNPTITNNIISGNTRHGIYNDANSNSIIINNTITGNSFNGIYNTNSIPTITNNIITSNLQYGIAIGGVGTPINTYNDVWGNTLGDYSGLGAGVGSISQNPQLDGTFHLTSSSPCIDAGTDAGVYDDMDGDSRPLGAGFDIGADEYVPQVPFANPIAAFIPLKNYHLRQVNTCLGCITDHLPEDVPEDVQTLLDEMQEHINNANTTGNTIYANNELLKALKCCEDIQEILGITCAL